jgi:hypothetical protein
MLTNVCLQTIVFAQAANGLIISSLGDFPQGPAGGGAKLSKGACGLLLSKYPLVFQHFSGSSRESRLFLSTGTQ